MIRFILSKIYEAIVNNRNRKFQDAPIYSKNNIRTKDKYFKIQYDSKIISVGNLSAGGTGKTPLTIEIINSYLPKDKTVCVVGRNYKTRSTDDLIVHGRGKSGEFADPIWLGDEMSLIQSKTRANVVAGPKKYRNAFIADEKYHPDVIIIDDGFQHQWIKRDLDIVIIDKVTIEKPYVYPRGKLREPLSSLLRADIILTSQGLEITKIYPYLKRDPLLCGFEIIQEKAYSLFDVNQKIEDFNTGLIPVVGIANPQRFLQSLDKLGVNYDKNNIKIFDDHHRYRYNDIVSICKLAQKQSSSIITTEKDAVKLAQNKGIFDDYNVSIFVLPIRLKITKNDDQFFEKINSIF